MLNIFYLHLHIIRYRGGLAVGLFNYDLEPRRDIIFMDIKSNYASIECVLLGLDPLKASLCVMSHADNSSGLILAASPVFKNVFGKSNVGRSRDLPFCAKTRKFNYRRWYDITPSNEYGQIPPPEVKYVEHVEYWAKLTYIVPPQMSIYIEKNIEINKILAEFTSVDEIHTYSIDESFLDVTESLDYFFPNEKDKRIQLDVLARSIQLKIFRQTGLYATMGLSNCNPLLAKLAMDNYAKKSDNMRTLINYEDVEEKLWAIAEMTDFWGIGKRTKIRLNNMGIMNIRDLANYNTDRMKQVMGIMGLQLIAHANGIDETSIYDEYKQKNTSFSNSQVLPRDYTTRDEIEVVINEMCEQIAVRLRKNKKMATSIACYVGFSMKENRKSIKIAKKINPTNNTNEIQEFIIRLFREKYVGGAVRNIGLSGNDLTDEAVKQLSFFDVSETNEESEYRKKEEKIQEAIDKIRKKHNFSTVQKATYLTKGSRVIARTKMIGGHSAGGYEGLK